MEVELKNFLAPYIQMPLEKMLSGHAYGRALRAHILLLAVQATVVLNEIDFSAEERSTIETTLRKTDSTLIVDERLQDVFCKFNKAMNKIKSKGEAAKLW